eukprot:TRINITY_DN10976_c1_g1_i1.p1 TRINITY_DN10976_c1_g1~~TRINITY_DN10976_c1_g1_i1.p1  ORF type:complete len:499 (+),score=79.70 TRINITY_DN10976_c1_g1_i1:57-1553(+)
MGRRPSVHNVVAKAARQKERQKKQDEWSPLRKRLFGVVTSSYFETVINVVLLANIGVMIAETNAAAQSYLPSWIQAINIVFLTVYFMEITLRIIIEGVYFFTESMNLFDFSLVAIDVVLQVIVFSMSAALPSVSVLRLVKVFRLLRAIRALSAFRELWMMLHGLISALKAMVWACLLVGIVLLIWSILSVELLNGLVKDLHEAQKLGNDCEHCASAFESVQSSMLTWFIVVFTGDMWMDLVVPVLKAQPWTMIMIFPSFFVIHFGMLNLILTVIVDRASEARAEDHQMTTSQKRQDLDNATLKLSALCQAMDSDKSGCLTLDELTQGFEDYEEFKYALMAMDVHKDDLTTVFSILDQDKSGTVAYEEFVKQLHKMKTEESHTLLIFIKHHMEVVLDRVEKQVSLLGNWIETNSTRQDAEIRHMKHTISRRMTQDSLSSHSAGNSPMHSNHPDDICSPAGARPILEDFEHDSMSDSGSKACAQARSPSNATTSRRTAMV